MSKKIGIENFRVFKDYTEFELRPITLLTGPNNSGKSSFTKLLLLLKNGLNKLRFEYGKHNLEDFGSVINWDSNSKNIKISLTSTIPILDDTFMSEFIYEDGKINQFNIKDNQNQLLTVEFIKTKTTNFGFDSVNLSKKISFNINLLIDIILEKHICVKHIDRNIIDKVSSYYWKPLHTVDRSKDITRSINLSRLKEKYYEFYKDNKFDILDDLRNLALHNEIDQLQGERLLFELIVDGKNATEYYREDLLKTQEEYFNNLEFPYQLGPDMGPDDTLLLISNIFKNIYPRVKKKVEKHFVDEFNLENLEIKSSRLANLIFEEKIFEDDIQIGEYFQKTMFEKFQTLKYGHSGFFNKINYISANRGNQKRVLHNTSDNDIDEIILQFSKLKEKNLPFLQEILMVLGIEGELIVERYQNYISVVYIKSGEKKIPLSDLGFGYSQVLPIILKIITEMQSAGLGIMGMRLPTDIVFIIEEPEANLHPNLQSALADILTKAIAYYPGLSFIVETHSEYLIRKLQFLTAKKELGTDKSVIYYFNSDKYVTAREQKVKKIEITQTGNLTDNFGPGFYDEATRLQFELLKINQEQNN